MALSTLADLVPEMERLGDSEAIRYDNGFRTFHFSYRELLDRIRVFQGYLASRGLGSGSRVILWSENRPEWIFAFWACVLSGIQVVPLDSRSDVEMIGRILEQVGADLLLHGEETDAASWPNRKRLTRVSREQYPVPPPSDRIDPEQPVQILFTSGTTGRPSGVIHRHRNICSNLEPFRLEIQRYRWIAWPFQPVRILNLLPLSQFFPCLLVSVLRPGKTQNPPKLQGRHKGLKASVETRHIDDAQHPFLGLFLAVQDQKMPHTPLDQVFHPFIPACVRHGQVTEQLVTAADGGLAQTCH